MFNVLISTNDENIVIFSEYGLSLFEVACFASSCGVVVNDVSIVKDEELQYYCYSPVWVSTKEARDKIAKKAEEYEKTLTEEQVIRMYQKFGLGKPLYISRDKWDAVLEKHKLLEAYGIEV